MGKSIYPGMGWKTMESHIKVGVAVVLLVVGFFISLKVSKSVEERCEQKINLKIE